MPVGIHACWGVLALAIAAGCGTNPLPSGQRPPPPAKQLTSVGRIPVHAYEHLAGDGYARTLIKAAASNNVSIEVRNIVIKAKGTSELSAGLGPGLVELVAGAGTISVGGRDSALTVNEIFTFGADEGATLRNASDQPLVVHLYLFGVH